MQAALVMKQHWLEMNLNADGSRRICHIAKEDAWADNLCVKCLRDSRCKSPEAYERYKTLALCEDCQKIYDFDK